MHYNLKISSKLVALIFFLINYHSLSFAQQIRPANSTTIYHELNQLKNLVNVLYVAAHPDDENTRLLSWLVNDQHIRTGYLSLTRGDGGQNILGSEQGDALGLIRTHELLEARKIDGAEQYFTRAIDFGFSKNFKETFRHWDKDTLIRDAVWVMRQFRPDVVICRFPPDSMAGHGQHAASAIIGAEAFATTSNGTKYPEQLKYFPNWKPSRLFFNAFRFGTFNTTTEDMFKIKVGSYEPLLGMGTGELAGISRSVHKSQGAGTPSVAGIQTEYFKLNAGEPITQSLFDGVNTTWGRVDRLDIAKDIEKIINDFNFSYPDTSIINLLQLRKKIATVNNEYWKTEKLKELDKIIFDCIGFMAEATTKQPEAVAGDVLPFTLQVVARSHLPIHIKAINWYGDLENVNIILFPDSLKSWEHKVTIPQTTAITQPYWLADNHSSSLFTIPNDTLNGLPESPNQLNALITIIIGEEEFKIPVPLSYKKLDPVKGDVVEQLRIVPDISIDFMSNLVICNTLGAFQTQCTVHPAKAMDSLKAYFYLSSNNNFNQQDSLLLIDSINYFHVKSYIDTSFFIKYNPKFAIPEKYKNGYLGIQVIKNKIYNTTQHVIRYNHIPTLQYFTTACTHLVPNQWKCAAKKVGYVEGAGDYLPTFLKLAGLDVEILKEADFTNAANLKKYDAIILGIRAINVEKKMAKWMPSLLQYAALGGTLVVQYNTLQDLSTINIGPYPITLSTKRVTEEDATITFLDEKNPVLNFPNKITTSDFKDWVQERGLYFPVKWDERYKTLFEMHDEGELPLTGNTLFAKTGKGNYIYTSLSFSRQIPAGNVGAIRLLMNMISVGNMK